VYALQNMKIKENIDYIKIARNIFYGRKNELDGAAARSLLLVMNRMSESDLHIFGPYISRMPYEAIKYIIDIGHYDTFISLFVHYPSLVGCASITNKDIIFLLKEYCEQHMNALNIYGVYSSLVVAVLCCEDIDIDTRLTLVAEMLSRKNVIKHIDAIADHMFNRFGKMSPKDMDILLQKIAQNKVCSIIIDSLVKRVSDCVYNDWFKSNSVEERVIGSLSSNGLLSAAHRASILYAIAQASKYYNLLRVLIAW